MTIIERERKKMRSDSPERKPGCGLITIIFGRNKSVSAGSSPIANNFENLPKDEKWECVGSKEFVSNNDVTNSSSHSISNPHKPTRVVSHGKPQNLNEMRIKKDPSHTQGYVNQGRRVPKEVDGIFDELESMINDHLVSKRGNSPAQASSNNVMLLVI